MCLHPLRVDAAGVQLMETVCQRSAVTDAAGDDLPLGDFQHRCRFDLDDMDIVFQLDFVACLSLLRGKDMVLVKEPDVFFLGQGAEGLRRGAQDGQSAALGLLHPVLGIPIL